MNNLTTCLPVLRVTQIAGSERIVSILIPNMGSPMLAGGTCAQSDSVRIIYISGTVSLHVSSGFAAHVLSAMADLIR